MAAGVSGARLRYSASRVMAAESRWSPWLKEPLLHFLVIGALLFIASAWRGGGPGAGRIVITAGQIDAMVAGFTRTWQRPPAPDELKRLVDDHVREEIAVREAVAMGLDRDDTIIRRRLRQKFEFLIEDTLDLAPPTDAELQAWMDQHPRAFLADPRVSFRQVHLSPEKRGASLDREARILLARLEAAGPAVSVDALGDSRLLPREVRETTAADVAREFGQPFADAILAAPMARWTGPIPSEYGVHLVLVQRREQGRPLTLAEARPQAERDVLADRRARQLNGTYERLLERYRVTLEERPGTTDGKSESPRDGGR